MSDLSAHARAILDAGRTALTPPEAVRLRVRAAVDARVTGPGPGGASAAGGGVAKLVLLSCVGLSVVAGVVVVAWHASRPRVHGEAIRERPAPRLVPQASSDVVPQPIVTQLSPEQPAPRRRPRQPSVEPAPGLAKELAMLDEARAALRAGAPAEAIVALDRHRREIRAPQLEREALLLRGEALCAGADRAAGVRILDEVVARWPLANGVEAVRSRCRDHARPARDPAPH
jgi:hypothetical protein